MIPPFNYGGVSQAPFGFPMSQNRFAAPTWSYAMEVHPPATIVELGCMNGGFTTLLGLHAWRIGAQVFSFDRQKAPCEDWQNLTNFLGVKFFECDIFEKIDFITDLIRRPGVAYVLCDNGDKPREFNLLAPKLKIGDVIGAHDYSAPPMGSEYWPWGEIYPHQVEQSVKDNNLQPFLQNHFDYAGWLVYKKEA